ncbi:MAG: acyltransferase [Paludibacteraceae bacterium]|nr:acyltransferase [Paludibacteraceae bacterium]
MMGLAILGILWGHLMNETWQPVVLSQIARLVHTAGFIFLSGFGLYYALSKGPSISTFYKKRLTRIFIPYVILTFWFFIVAFVAGQDSLCKFLTNMIAMSFWIYGVKGTWAMWYVSVTLVLYLISPILFILFNGKKPFANTIIFIGIYSLFLVGLACMFPHYWTITKIGLVRVIMFVLGMYTGYLALHHKSANGWQILFYFALIGILLLIAKLWIDDEVYAILRTLIGMPLLLMFLKLLGHSTFMDKLIHQPLAFFGKCSYELYLIHVVIFYWFRDIIGLNSATSMIIGISIALALCYPIHLGLDWCIKKL